MTYAKMGTAKKIAKMKYFSPILDAVAKFAYYEFKTPNAKIRIARSFRICTVVSPPLPRFGDPNLARVMWPIESAFGVQFQGVCRTHVPRRGVALGPCSRAMGDQIPPPPSLSSTCLSGPHNTLKSPPPAYDRLPPPFPTKTFPASATGCPLQSDSVSPDMLTSTISSLPFVVPISVPP